MKELRLNRAQWEQMQAHIEACLPEEACGLLAGVDGTISEVIPVENQVHSPVRFRMEPAAQLSAFERMDAHGWQMLGIFHSHPAGPANPSPTDIAEAAYDVVHVIWSPGAGSWQARAFLIRSGLASEVKLEVAG